MRRSNDGGIAYHYSQFSCYKRLNGREISHVSALAIWLAMGVAKTGLLRTQWCAVIDLCVVMRECRLNRDVQFRTHERSHRYLYKQQLEDHDDCEYDARQSGNSHLVLAVTRGNGFAMPRYLHRVDVTILGRSDSIYLTSLNLGSASSSIYCRTIGRCPPGLSSMPASTRQASMWTKSHRATGRKCTSSLEARMAFSQENLPPSAY